MWLRLIAVVGYLRSRVLRLLLMPVCLGNECMRRRQLITYNAVDRDIEDGDLVNDVTLVTATSWLSGSGRYVSLTRMSERLVSW